MPKIKPIKPINFLSNKRGKTLPTQNKMVEKHIKSVSGIEIIQTNQYEQTNS